jgi:tetratricopeptide (TPR) repeat protein
MRYAQLLVAVVLTLGTPCAGIAQSLPAAGMIAEAAGQSDEAIRLYRQALEREPRRGELWVRIADIEAQRGNLPASIASLNQAAQALPADPAIYRRLSQAYALSNKPLAALEAIRGALALAPNNIEYLEAAATLATWQGDYHLAARTYLQLQKLGHHDDDLALKLARVSAWGGETDQAVSAFRRYLAAHADAADVWLELARTESWRGNYAAALNAVHVYRDKFGESAAYSRELASILARDGQPTEAVTLLDRLLRQDMSNYELNVTRTIALAMQQRPRETFDSLDSVRQLNPSDRQTRSAEGLVRATLGSTVEPGFTFYSDSDRLRVTRIAPFATALLATGTQFSAGFERQTLEAPEQGGLGRFGGGAAQYDYGWAAIAQKIGRVTIQGSAGTARADDHTMTPYAVSARIRPSDSLSLTVESGRGFFVISPRTVELGLTERHQQLAADWAPGVLYHVSAEGSYRQLSDGNDRWEMFVAPRRAVARTESLNLDVGVSAYALGTTKDLPNGYYDPRRYESYAAVMYPYFKLSENVGLGASLAAGVQREHSTPSFRFGGNASVEATIGIYRPWVLKFSGSATNNRRVGSGAFQGYSGGAVLIRRF